jgi:hypothetical protein
MGTHQEKNSPDISIGAACIKRFLVAPKRHLETEEDYFKRSIFFDSTLDPATSL